MGWRDGGNGSLERLMACRSAKNAYQSIPFENRWHSVLSVRHAARGLPASTGHMLPIPSAGVATLRASFNAHLCSPDRGRPKAGGPSAAGYEDRALRQAPELELANVNDAQDRSGELPTFRQSCERNAGRVSYDVAKMEGMGRRFPNRKTRTQRNSRIPGLGLRTGGHRRRRESRSNGEQSSRATPGGRFMGLGPGIDRGFAPISKAAAAARCGWPALFDQSRNQCPVLRDA